MPFLSNRLKLLKHEPYKCLISGQLIVGTSQVNDDWWYGKIGERTGIFPTTYTWHLDSKLLKVS
jgi:hypothetical protein